MRLAQQVCYKIMHMCWKIMKAGFRAHEAMNVNQQKPAFAGVLKTRRLRERQSGQRAIGVVGDPSFHRWVKQGQKVLVPLVTGRDKLT